MCLPCVTFRLFSQDVFFFFKCPVTPVLKILFMSFLLPSKFFIHYSFGPARKVKQKTYMKKKIILNFFFENFCRFLCKISQCSIDTKSKRKKSRSLRFSLWIHENCATHMGPEYFILFYFFASTRFPKSMLFI